MKPQDEGRLFESQVAKQFGAQVQPGSGSGPFFKLDVKGQQFISSCKWTQHQSYRLTQGEIDEATAAVDAPGGVGGSTLPMMNLNIGGEELVVMRASDFIRIVKDDMKLAIPSKGEARAVRARRPALFRDDDLDP